jgi:hypothetical protein
VAHAGVLGVGRAEDLGGLGLPVGRVDLFDVEDGQDDPLQLTSPANSSGRSRVIGMGQIVPSARRIWLQTFS